MATGTVIYRPSSDVSLAHSCNSGSSGYVLLSEITADNDSTYIQQDISSTFGGTNTSSFRLSADSQIPTNAKLTSCRVYIIAKKTNTDATATLSATVTVGSSPSEDITDVNLTTNYASYNGTHTLQDLDATSTVEISVTTSGKKGSSKDDTSYIRITQIYIEIDYTYTEETGSGLYFKQNNQWIESKSIYKKENGTWIVIDKSEIDSQIKYIIK